MSTATLPLALHTYPFSLPFDLSRAAASDAPHSSRHFPDLKARPLFKSPFHNHARLISSMQILTSPPWLRGVAKVCRLAGYAVQDWSTFASTLFAGVPLDLFDAAENQADQLVLNLLSGASST